MKDLLAVFGMIFAALVAGAILFFFGPTAFMQIFHTDGPQTNITILDQGSLAVGIDERMNALIRNPDELQQLWTTVHSAEVAAPAVDFSKYQVIAVFEGSHATDGYAIHVQSVVDRGDTRTVTVMRTVPGPACTTNPKITSPFEVVRVPTSTLTLTHVDVTVTAACP